MKRLLFLVMGAILMQAFPLISANADCPADTSPLSQNAGDYSATIKMNDDDTYQIVYYGKLKDGASYEGLLTTKEAFNWDEGESIPSPYDTDANSKEQWSLIKDQRIFLMHAVDIGIGALPINLVGDCEPLHEASSYLSGILRCVEYEKRSVNGKIRDEIVSALPSVQVNSEIKFGQLLALLIHYQDEDEICLGANGLTISYLLNAGKALADEDLDAVPDAYDNCPDDANFDQADADLDDVGDACDPDAGAVDSTVDRDYDTIPDVDDLCPDIPGYIEYDGCPSATADAEDSEQEIAVPATTSSRADTGGFCSLVTSASALPSPLPFLAWMGSLLPLIRRRWRR